jgi:hypothetical protein
MPDGNPLLEIRTLPEDIVNLWETNALWQRFNGLLHGILVVNRADCLIRIDSIEIEIEDRGETTRSWLLPAAGVRSAAGGAFDLDRQGLLQAYDYVFQLRRLIPPGVALAQSEMLRPNTGLAILKHQIDLSAGDGPLRITARGCSADGQEVLVAKELHVVAETMGDFALPVRGSWLVRAGPSYYTHHRWAPSDEFALDLVRCGASGVTHEGSGSAPPDHYAYGEDVVAAASGEIIVSAGSVEEQSDLLQRSDEDDNAYYGRFSTASMEMLLEDPISGYGNYIVVKHARSLYSCYAHLMHGSLRVRPGDTVEAGQVMAEVGQTGSSPSPHLHFKICDGPSPLADRSLPVCFRDIRVVGRPNSGYLHSGDLIQTI